MIHQQSDQSKLISCSAPAIFFKKRLTNMLVKVTNGFQGSTEYSAVAQGRQEYN